MTFTHGLSTNRYGEADLIVDTDPSRGTHITLASAISAATSGQTIFLRTSVTENVTLPSGINIAAWAGGSLNTPTIIGTITCTDAGTRTISGIRLQTNSAALLAVTGSAATIVNLENCYLNMTNNTGITFSSSSASAQINMTNCQGDLGTTGIAIFAHSSAGTLNAYQTTFTNTGGSSTANTASAGTTRLITFSCKNPITTSGTATLVSVSLTIDSATQNATSFTNGGSGNATVYYGAFSSGTASAISTSQTLNLYASVVNSSNTNAITGAGTIVYAGLSFTSSSNINTTTQTISNSGPSATFGSTNSGNTNTLTVTNSSNTATSAANIVATVAGATAADPTHQAVISGVTTWTWGADNSDSDAFVLAASASLGTTNVMRIATTGEINYPLQSAFQGYLGTTATDKTGAGTVYTLGTDALTEVFDQNSDFNTNGTFTAPVTGLYQLTAQMHFIGQTVGTSNTVNLITSNRSYRFVNAKAGNANSMAATICMLTDMDSSDTFTVTGVGSGEAGDTQDISGVTPFSSFMSGKLSC